MNNKGKINRFDPFMPIKFSGIDKSTTNNTLEVENIDFVEKSFGFTQLNDEFKIEMPHVKKGVTFLFSKKVIGDNTLLGEKLLEDFVFALSEGIELPQYIILINEAVYLLEKKNIVECIFKMQKYGVKFFTSLESVEYFNYVNKIKGLTNITTADIAEKIMYSQKIINM